MKWCLPTIIMLVILILLACLMLGCATTVRPEFPAIGLVNTPDGVHEIIVWDEDDEFYLFTDDGTLGGDGIIPKIAVKKWRRK